MSTDAARNIKQKYFMDISLTTIEDLSQWIQNWSPNRFQTKNIFNTIEIKFITRCQLNLCVYKRGLTRLMLIVDLAFLRYLIQFLKAIKLVVAICIACFVPTICERDVMIYNQTCYYIFFTYINSLGI